MKCKVPWCKTESVEGTIRCARHNADEARYMRTKRKNIRAKVLAKMGGACACCGETIEAFLCLDHVQNDGADERRSLVKGNRGGGAYRTYQKAWALGCPPERYQLLCANCNHGKQLCGVCPHKKGIA